MCGRLHLKVTVAQDGWAWTWEMVGEAPSDRVGQLVPAEENLVRSDRGWVRGAGRMASCFSGVPSESGRRMGSFSNLCVKGSHCHSKPIVCSRGHSGEYASYGF